MTEDFQKHLPKLDPSIGIAGSAFGARAAPTSCGAFMPVRLIAATVLIAMFGLTTARANDAIVTTLEGETHRGPVTAWNQTSLTVATDEGPVQIEAEQLLSVTYSDRVVESSAEPAITLIDGSRLTANRYSTSGDVATIGLGLTSGLQSVSKSAVHRVEFAPLAEKLSPLWGMLDSKQLVGDALVIRKQIDAGPATELDYLTGVVQDVSSEQVEFVWDGDAISVRLAKVAGIAYYRPAAAKTEDALCQIYTTDGSILAVRRIVLQQSRLEVETVAGLKLKFSPMQIAEVDYSMGKLIYLSDLEPLAQQWTPYIALPDGATQLASSGLPRFDQAQDGGPLSLEIEDDQGHSHVESYRKGIALRSYSELLYRVPPEMRVFVAQAGIHPGARSQGHVTLEVFADRSLVWQGEISGDEPPQQIEASVKNARRLRIVVGYGDNLDYGDQLHLVEARMMR